MFDFQHVNSQCHVLPQITPHIFADSDYLKPGVTILPIKGKNRLFLETSVQLYIELAGWNRITDSLVFSVPSYDVIS